MVIWFGAKLLNNELKIRSKKYLVQSRSFAEMLEATIRRYQNRTIEAAQVIPELIELTKQMRGGQKARRRIEFRHLTPAPQPLK